MAFGFRRLSGSSRNYASDATGEIISRRQYDKIAAGVAAKPAPFAGARVGKGATLAAARAASEARVATLEARSRPGKRALAAAIKERDAARAAQDTHHARQGGQRAYNAALDLYVRRERERGSRASRRDLRASSEFKDIMAGLKPEKTRRRESPDARRARQRRNARRRDLTFRLLGDKSGEEFREQYDKNELEIEEDEDE